MAARRSRHRRRRLRPRRGRRVAAHGEAVRRAPRLGESRWIPAAALVVFMAMNIALRVWLPNDSAVRVPWLVPAVEAALLVMLVVSDPGNLVRYHRTLRRVALGLVVLLVAAELWATALLIYDLVHGTGVADSASRLLATGAVVWTGNNLAFALLYWLIDGGGPIARSRRPAPIDFAFTQHMSPELAPVSYTHLTLPTNREV